MTHHTMGSPKLDKSGLPTNAKIRHAVAEVASTLDLEETSFKKMQSLIAKKLGVTIEDLSSKKNFIKKCLEEKEEKAHRARDDDNDSIPTENEIREAAKKLASTVDLEVTTFKKFVKLVEDKMDCEDLTPAKSTIQEVYDDGKEINAKIIKAAKKLARSSKVDLEKISNHKFLNMLQEVVREIDLSLKKDLVYKTLKERKRKYHARVNESMPVSDVPTSHATNSTKLNTHQNVDEVMAMSKYHNAHDNSSKKPQKVVGNPKCSLDLEQGCKIPEAAGMKWTDNFFDNDTDDLVAVFDHDYKAMFWYAMKVRIITVIVPVFITLLGLAVVIFWLSSLIQKSINENDVMQKDPTESYPIWNSSSSINTMESTPVQISEVESDSGLGNLIGALVVVFALVYLVLSLYGSYRLIKSYVHSLHLAVKRDGICFVQDDHIEGRAIIAALHIFDACIFVSKRSETIPFDQITKLTVKDPGEIDDACCCWWCCFCCFRFPVYKVAMDTASSDPGYYANVMTGLILPHEFQKLAWGMKRDKGEEIHRRTEQNTAAMCSAMMFDNMMKYGMSPVQPPIPGTVGGSCNTAPTMSVSSASTPSYVIHNQRCDRSSNGIDL